MTGRRGRVVVTGAGVLHPFGGGVESLAQALEEGAVRALPVDPLPGAARPRRARQAARVPRLDLGRWIPPLVARRMSPPSRLAVAAARQALEDAARPLSAAPDPAMGVALGTSFGPASFTERLLEQIESEGPDAASPSLFTECVANAAAAQIAIHCRAAGPSLTLSQGQGSPLLAASRAAAAIASGKAACMLAGGVEEMTPLLHALLDRFGALVRSAPGETEIPRPLDRRRAGCLAGEGAAVLVLEDEGAARRRGARTRAWLRAWGSAFDPSAPAAGWGRDTDALGRALRGGLVRFDLEPGQIDRIVSGASGSRGGDAVEAQVLRAAWDGAPLPPLHAPKGILGEYGGSLLPAALAILEGARVSPGGFQEADPHLGVVPHPGGDLPAPRRLLVTTASAGGGHAWLVLEAA